jgi:Transposase
MTLLTVLPRLRTNNLKGLGATLTINLQANGQTGKREQGFGSVGSGATATRRRWSTIEKLRIVEESQAASASVVDVARRNDLHPNLLTAWRRQARTGSQ